MDNPLKLMFGFLLAGMVLMLAAGVLDANYSVPKIKVTDAIMQACLDAGRTPTMEVDAVARTALFRCEEKSP